MDKKLTKNLSKFMETLTPKQARFFSEWIKTGNGTKSAMIAYETNNVNTAAQMATENLRKLKNPVKIFLEANGLSLGHLSKVLIEAMNATKWNDFTGEREADHRTRMESVDRLSKWLDVPSKNEEQPDNLKRRIVAEEFFGGDE